MDIQLKIHNYYIADRIFQLKRVGNLDDLVDQISDEDFNADERLPYWAELWPSAIALSRFILNNEELFNGKSVLELGCGLGLTSLSLASLDCKSFLTTDYEQDALDILKENFLLNGFRAPQLKLLDWREPALSARYDVIIASDVLYEERFFLPLQRLINNYLTKDGLVIIAEPNRPIARHFFYRLLESGYVDKTVDEIVTQDDHDIKVSIHLIKKDESKK